MAAKIGYERKVRDMAENINKDQNSKNSNNNNNQDGNEVIHLMAVPTLLDDLMMEIDEGPGKYPVS